MSNNIDLLNREYFIENVIKVVNSLSEIKKGCCFSIEGSWGIGKTFVLERIEQQLNQIQSEETYSDRYFVFHYNCWKYDYYEEPSVAIISAMLSSVKEEQSVVNEKIDTTVISGWKYVKGILKDIAGIYIKNKIGVNLICAIDDITEIKENAEIQTYEFDTMFNFTKTIDEVREQLKKIAEDRTLVLIVDELDRCIPNYAIKVLERLHHIFEGLDNVIVIMAIDRAQLEHSIIQMFGEKENSIDVKRYLRKFIDFSMKLDNGTVNKSFEEKYEYYCSKFCECKESDHEIVNEIIPILLKGIDIRSQEKLIEKANMIHSIICGDKVDIAVMIFEIMYEALELNSSTDFHKIISVQNTHFSEFEKKVGKEKYDLFIKISKKSFSGRKIFGSQRKDEITAILYGRIFWIISSFCDEFNSLYLPTQEEVNLQVRNIETAHKYIEYCKIIK